MNQKQPRIELPKLRKAAHLADCRMRLPGICNYDPSTTVLAHRNRLGMGMKQHDFNAMNMCSACHNVYDGRTNSDWTNQEVVARFDDKWPAQVEWWFREGLLK